MNKSMKDDRPKGWLMTEHFSFCAFKFLHFTYLSACVK